MFKNEKSVLSSTELLSYIRVQPLDFSCNSLLNWVIVFFAVNGVILFLCERQCNYYNLLQNCELDLWEIRQEKSFNAKPGKVRIRTNCGPSGWTLSQFL